MAALWLVGILGEGGEEGIGQNDHFMVVQFAHVGIRQNAYFLGQLSLGRSEANYGDPVQGCAQDVAQALSMRAGRAEQFWSFLLPLFTQVPRR